MRLAKEYGADSNSGGRVAKDTAGGALIGEAPPYFIIGDVTGTESDAGPVRLSGRGLLYIDPYQMGFVDFEYWGKAGQSAAEGSGGGAGILQAQPLAFGGYWGGNLIGAPGSIYYNDSGYAYHTGDDWGYIGSLSAPWR